MLEERDARIAVLEAALEPFAKIAKMWSDKADGRLQLSVDEAYGKGDFTLDTLRRAAAAYPTHSEGGEAYSTAVEQRTTGEHIAQPLSDEDCSAAAWRSQAEANVLAVRSWDSPGFEACVKAEMEKIKAARAISPMQVQHANEAWNAQPADASEEDRMKAALETLGASPSPSALAEEGVTEAWTDSARERHRELLAHLHFKQDDNIPGADVLWLMMRAAEAASALSPKGGTYA